MGGCAYVIDLGGLCVCVLGLCVCLYVCVYVCMRLMCMYALRGNSLVNCLHVWLHVLFGSW